MHILITLSPWIPDIGVVDSQIGTSLDPYMFRLLPLRCNMHVLCSIRKKCMTLGLCSSMKLSYNSPIFFFNHCAYCFGLYLCILIAIQPHKYLILYYVFPNACLFSFGSINCRLNQKGRGGNSSEAPESIAEETRCFCGEPARCESGGVQCSRDSVCGTLGSVVSWAARHYVLLSGERFCSFQSVWHAVHCKARRVVLVRETGGTASALACRISSCLCIVSTELLSTVASG